MVEAMMRYSPLAASNTTCYRVNITRTSGQYFANATFHSGANPLQTASGEIFILLDWSSLAGLFGGASTINIAEATAAALQSPNLIPALGGRALAELPLHLAGHSRGASVAAETARVLGAQGIWVDQLTSWDPVPTGFLGDPSMKNYANILYTDNYWQNIGSPSGQPLAGAYNRRLTNLDNSDAHSEVHLWYHGTLDFSTELTVDNLTVDESRRQNWWSSFEQRGTNAGYRLSRIGGGDRLSEVEPVGPGLGRISDGFNRFYDVGAGVAPNRDALPANNGAWPNPIRLLHAASHPLPPGAEIPVTLRYQAAATPLATTQLQWSLDPDENAFNSNEWTVGTTTLPGSGPNAVLLLAANLPTSLLSLPPGPYWLRASLTLTNRTRHLYAAQPVLIAPSLMPPSLLALGFTNGQFRLLVRGEAGQRIITEATTDFVIWNGIATNVLATEAVEVWDAAAGDFEQRYYRAVAQP